MLDLIMEAKMTWKSDDFKNEMIRIRQALHEIPELGNLEHKTSEFIQKKLKSMGVPFEVVLDTGIVALIKGKSSKRVVAFRADMDALPVSEETGVPYASKHNGCMHACGHDAHMAMLIGLAEALTSDHMEVVDDIVLIFQPAEEGPGGAKRIVELGIFEKYGIQEIYGIHVYPELEQGKFSSCPGAMMGMVGEFDIEIKASSAHGAMPHTGNDAMIVAAECVMGIQTIISRNIDPMEGAVLTVGKLNSGERRNIIAGSAVLEGTIRAFDPTVYETMMLRLDALIRGLEISYGVEIKLTTKDLYPSIQNDKDLFDAFKSLYAEKVVLQKPQMISEDFSFYQRKVPGLFYFLGTGNKDLGYVYPLHHSKFNLDGSVLMLGVESYLDILKSKAAIKEK